MGYHFSNQTLITSAVGSINDWKNAHVYILLPCCDLHQYFFVKINTQVTTSDFLSFTGKKKFINKIG